MKKKKLILLVLLAINLFCYSQDFKLHVKVSLLPELKEILSKEEIQLNIYNPGSPFAVKSVIISDLTDTIIEYSKKNTPFNLDTIYISISCNVRKASFDKDYSLNLHYILETNIIKEVFTEFPENCLYNRQSASSFCTRCKKSDEVIPIIYSDRQPIVDRNGNVATVYPKEYMMGDDFSDCHPTWYCKRDKFKF
ncbi:MAG: hypothetical protein QM791_09725 [Ferruginibacter sp.]